MHNNYPDQPEVLDALDILSLVAILVFKVAVIHAYFKKPLTRFFKECFSKNDRVKKDLIYARSIYGNDKTEMTEPKEEKKVIRIRRSKKIENVEALLIPSTSVNVGGIYALT